MGRFDRGVLLGLVLSSIGVSMVRAETFVTQATENTITIGKVEVQPTATGLSVVVTAKDGTLVNPIVRTQGRLWFADIPNAKLENPFRQESPLTGIEYVSVSQVSETFVRIIVAGKDKLPAVQAKIEEMNLQLSVIPVIASAEENELDIVVSATRSTERREDVPRSVTVISRQQILEQARLTNNLPDILGKLVPGLAPPTLQPSTRTFTLRGRTALILIDNIPQTPSRGFGFELNTISPLVIERIEILRGPSAVFGNGATGGVINIITRKTIEEGTKNEIAAGFRNAIGGQFLPGDGFGSNLEYAFSGKDGPRDFTLSISQDVNRSIFDANGDRIPPNQLNDRVAFNLFAKVGYDVDPNQRLEFTYGRYQESVGTEFDSDPLAVAPPGLQTARTRRVGAITYDRPPAQTNQIFNLTFSHKNILNSELLAQIYYRDTRLAQIFADLRGRNFPSFFPLLFQTSLDSTEIGTRLQLNTPISSTAKVTWGVDYASEENNSPLLISDPAIFDRDRALRIVSRQFQTPFFTVNRLGVFSQLKWEISDQWIFNGGIRYDRFEFSVGDYEVAFNPPGLRFGGSATNDSVSLNAGLVYKLTPELSLFTSYAQGFSLPNLFNALFSLPAGQRITGSALVAPQKVDNYELGIRGNWGNIQSSIAGFYNTSSLGDAAGVNAEGFAETIRSPQRNFGLEAKGEWQATDRWKLGTSVTIQEGENDADNDGNFRPLSSILIPPLKVTFFVENKTLDNWTNRLQLLYIGDRSRAFNDRVDPFTINSYVTLDLLSSLKFGSSSLELGIDNLLNSQYLPISSQERTGATEGRRFAAPGRTISLRYKLEF